MELTLEMLASFTGGQIEVHNSHYRVPGYRYCYRGKIKECNLRDLDSGRVVNVHLSWKANLYLDKWISEQGTHIETIDISHCSTLDICDDQILIELPKLQRTVVFHKMDLIHPRRIR